MSAINDIRNIIWQNGITPKELLSYMPKMYIERLMYILNEGTKIDVDTYADFMKAFEKLGIDTEKKTPRLNLIGRTNKIAVMVMHLEADIILAEEDNVIDAKEKSSLVNTISDIRKKLDILETKVKGE